MLLHIEEPVVLPADAVAVHIGVAHLFIKAKRRRGGNEPGAAALRIELIGFQRVKKLGAVSLSDGLRREEQSVDQALVLAGLGRTPPMPRSASPSQST